MTLPHSLFVLPPVHGRHDSTRQHTGAFALRRRCPFRLAPPLPRFLTAPLPAFAHSLPLPALDSL